MSLSRVLTSSTSPRIKPGSVPFASGPDQQDSTSEEGRTQRECSPRGEKDRYAGLFRRIPSWPKSSPWAETEGWQPTLHTSLTFPVDGELETWVNDQLQPKSPLPPRHTSLGSGDQGSSPPVESLCHCKASHMPSLVQFHL